MVAPGTPFNSLGPPTLTRGPRARERRNEPRLRRRPLLSFLPGRTILSRGSPPRRSVPSRPSPKGRDPRVTVGPARIEVRLRPDAVDQLALDFCRSLSAAKVRYALVSGYVAIVLGRNRLSEDIDLFAQPLSFVRFRALHRSLNKTLECVTPGTPSRLFHDYLQAGDESTSIRYARPGTFSPNVEV